MPSKRTISGKTLTGPGLVLAEHQTPMKVRLVGRAIAAYNTQSSTTVRSVNSGGPSKISIMVALTT